LQKIRKSFLLLEALITMMLISIFVIAFVNITHTNNSLVSFASNKLYQEIIKSKCKPINSSKIISGMQLNQSYKIEYDKNTNSNIVVQYWNIDEKIYLKRRCYI
jgi:Tfp pilus assembly protein PilV